MSWCRLPKVVVQLVVRIIVLRILLAEDEGGMSGFCQLHSARRLSSPCKVPRSPQGTRTASNHASIPEQIRRCIRTLKRTTNERSGIISIRENVTCRGGLHRQHSRGHVSQCNLCRQRSRDPARNAFPTLIYFMSHWSMMMMAASLRPPYNATRPSS